MGPSTYWVFIVARRCWFSSWDRTSISKRLTVLAPKSGKETTELVGNGAGRMRGAHCE
jgi:hypothetical protein